MAIANDKSVSTSVKLLETLLASRIWTWYRSKKDQTK